MEAKMEANGSVHGRTWRDSVGPRTSPHVAPDAPDSARQRHVGTVALAVS
jgi:hypothetical protein